MKWYKHTSLKSANPIAIPFILLLLFSCGSGEDDPGMSGLSSVGFDIKVSGSFSRNMQGTNAYCKILQMPSGFVTTHQLAIYLTDGDGYTATAIILMNGNALPNTGNYGVNNLLGASTLKENDGLLSFGQNGGVSHTSAAASGGIITITEVGSDFVKGTIDGGLTATGTGSINIKGAFYAQLDD